MYDFLTLNTTKTQEKYKYLPQNIHFIVLHQPKRHKNHAAETSHSQYIA